jgi:hypothetical protein
MERLAEALQQLREERTHAQEQVTKLDRAIVAIEGIIGKGNSGLAGLGHKGNKRTMSVAARRKIAAAQRARWAKVKNLKPVLVTTKTSTARKRTLSPAARRKIAAAQRARWAKVKSNRKAA